MPKPPPPNTIPKPTLPALKALPDEWPAPVAHLEAGRAFLREAAASPHPVLLLPDRDADGITAGTIINRALRFLEKKPEHVLVHFWSPAAPLYSPENIQAVNEMIEKYSISHTIIIDQGSRPGPRLFTGGKIMVVDHHHTESFPSDTTMVSALPCPPVVTSSILAHKLVTPLSEELAEDTTWLALTGLYADLGPAAAGLFPPNAVPMLRPHRKMHLTQLVALLNAPRRAPGGNPRAAWDLLQLCPSPNNINSGKWRSDLINHCKRAKASWGNELGLVARTAPKWSEDGSVALIEIDSAWQVHPVVAQRWAGSLKGKAGKTKIVLCANKGWVHGKVNVSGRVVAEAQAEDGGDVDLIKMLWDLAARDEDVLKGVGEDWGRGHTQAAGGSVTPAVWKKFVQRCLKVEDKKKRKLAAAAEGEGEAEVEVEGEEAEGEGEGEAVEGEERKQGTLDTWMLTPRQKKALKDKEALKDKKLKKPPKVKKEKKVKKE
ncbi:hypothetical protein EDC01DRAFT_621170 [Geopyxis carbonaria]|nr:hypothetical protein EDC01DRAFT_621170 [Geopyxis carbonaria]